MSRIFDPEGPLFSGLERVADLFWLNILFVICCIPVITIGTSATSLYYVTMKMVKNEEGPITKSFFKAFKTNFKQSTVIWLIAMVIGAILYTDYAIMSGMWADISAMPDLMRKIMVLILLVAGVFYLLTLVYVFPLLARFDNTVKNTIKNALLIGIRHLPFSFLLFLIFAAPILLLYFMPGTIILFLIILFSLPAYISSYIFVKIFAYYTPEEEEKEET